MTLNYWAVSFIGRLRIVRFFDGRGTTPYTNESRVGLIRFRNFARGRSTASIAPGGMRGATRRDATSLPLPDRDVNYFTSSCPEVRRAPRPCDNSRTIALAPNCTYCLSFQSHTDGNGRDSPATPLNDCCDGNSLWNRGSASIGYSITMLPRDGVVCDIVAAVSASCLCRGINIKQAGMRRGGRGGRSLRPYFCYRRDASPQYCPSDTDLRPDAYARRCHWLFRSRLLNSRANRFLKLNRSYRPFGREISMSRRCSLSLL